MYHEPPLIIILNRVVVPFNNILHVDSYMQSLYSQFHHQQESSGHPMLLSLKIYFSTRWMLFLTVKQSHLESVESEATLKSTGNIIVHAVVEYNNAFKKDRI